MRVKIFIKRIPLVNKIAERFYEIFGSHRFPGSLHYWEERYQNSGTSGAGSYGRLAKFKADVINSFVRENKIGSVIEFGCGDGHQLSLAFYPQYVGLDVSPTAIKMCKEKFAQDKTKSFFLYDPFSFHYCPNVI